MHLARHTTASCKCCFIDLCPRPQRHIIFGDLGSTHGFSLCEACTAGSAVCDAETCATTPNTGLTFETDTADMWLHVGDFAYNFDSGHEGYIGDQFMRNIEQVAARVPYMVSHGNHEDSPANLANFVERFRNMPANAVPNTFTTIAGTTSNSMFYSWDAGLVLVPCHPSPLPLSSLSSLFTALDMCVCVRARVCVTCLDLYLFSLSSTRSRPCFDGHERHLYLLLCVLSPICGWLLRRNQKALYCAFNRAVVRC